MAAAVSVRAGMAARRVVTAADLAAHQADAQVQPCAPFPQAVLAALDRRRQLGDGDLVQMRA